MLAKFKCFYSLMSLKVKVSSCRSGAKCSNKPRHVTLFVTAPSPKPLKFQRRKQTQVCLKYNGLGDAMSSFFLKNNLTNYYMLNWSKVMGRKI